MQERNQSDRYKIQNWSLEICCCLLSLLSECTSSLAQRRCNFNLTSVSSMVTTIKTTTGITLPRAIFRNKLNAKDTFSGFNLKDEHKYIFQVPPRRHLALDWLFEEVAENCFFSFCPLTRNGLQAKSFCLKYWSRKVKSQVKKCARSVTKKENLKEWEWAREKCFPIRAKDVEKTWREVFWERYVIEALLKPICSCCLKRARVVELPYS